MDEQQKRDEGGDERWGWLLPRQATCRPPRSRSAATNTKRCRMHGCCRYPSFSPSSRGRVRRSMSRARRPSPGVGVPERARRAHRRASHRAAEERVEADHPADSDGGARADRTGVGGHRHDHEHEEGREHRLVEDGATRSDGRRRSIWCPTSSGGSGVARDSATASPRTSSAIIPIGRCATLSIRQRSGDSGRPPAAPERIVGVPA